MTAWTARTAAPKLQAGTRGAWDAVLFACLLATIGMQAHLAFVAEVNWDEFHYLAQVHEYARGELRLTLQTIHVHLFAPFVLGGGDEVSQVVRGRMVMLAAQMGTLALLYGLTRLVADRSASLLAVVAFATLSNTLVHGASFRVDPLATVLMMGALVAVAAPLRHPLRIACAVLAPALALMVTVKVALYAPAFLAVFGWRLSRTDAKLSVWIEWVAFAFGVLAAFGLLYLGHSQTLPIAEAARSTAMLSNAATVTLLETDWFPRFDVVRSAVMGNLQFTLLWLAGLAAAIATLVRGDGSRANAGLVLGLAATVLCFAAYRNAFPYFVPFILAPAAVAVGYGAMRWFPDAKMRALVAVVLAALAIGHYADARERDHTVQRDILEAVHAAFPDPVAVIDRNGMVASFPRANFFMSGWGVRNYLVRGRPIYRDLLAARTVPVLVLNSPLLRDAVGVAPVAGARLFEEDRRALRENFVHHAPFVWVAGKRLVAGPLEQSTEILVPGRYRLEAPAPVAIDGQLLQPGDVVALARGSLAYAAPARLPFTLKWDVADLGDPTPTTGVVYQGF